MTYNFDEIITRKGTDAFKWSNLGKTFGSDEVLPMWVADMDFATPPFIIRTIQNRLQHPVLGYTCSTEAYRQSIVDWCKGHYSWDIKPEHISYIPGVVAGIYLAVQTFTEKGDQILIQDPVYHPFRFVPEGSERVIKWNKLIPPQAPGDTFHMDLEQLKEDVQGCKMMILCNPHNPAGICWDKETLRSVAHICKEAGVLVISDEIHCDMLLGGRKHVPFATVSDEARENCITLQAPSKTFNMPGIVVSQAIVTCDTIREKYFSYIENSDMDLGNAFCYLCATACYSEEGDEWRRQMLQYVEGNIDCLEQGLKAFTDKITIIRPQASFLVFMDCRGLGFQSGDELNTFFTEKCHLAFNRGDMFGPAGEDYMRVNVGCPRSTVEEALKRIRKGLEQL